MLDQAALMMDAFAYCRRVRERLRADADIQDEGQQLARLIFSVLRQH